MLWGRVPSFTSGISNTDVFLLLGHVGSSRKTPFFILDLPKGRSWRPKHRTVSDLTMENLITKNHEGAIIMKLTFVILHSVVLEVNKF